MNPVEIFQTPVSKPKEIPGSWLSAALLHGAKGKPQLMVFPAFP